MKILDRYIIQKFLLTLFFMIMIISIIVVVIDINEKIAYSGGDREFKISDAFKNYYPYFIIWILNRFNGVLIFISVLFFTSKMASNTEIIAIISSGVSFYRFSRPYIIVAIFIMLISMCLNHWILPWINKKKNIFEYSLKSKNFKLLYNQNQLIASKLSDTDYLFINSYSRENKNGTGFHYQKFNASNLMTYELIASNLKWNEIDSIYILYNCFERTIHEKQDILKYGIKINRKFKFTPDELLPEEYIAEVINTKKLLKLINKEIKKGSKDIYKYYVELYHRVSIPFSALILTILGLSIASEKRKNGIGINLAISLIFTFIYIFSFEILRRFASSGDLNPFFSAFIPNMLFGITTLYLYFRRANM